MSKYTTGEIAKLCGVSVRTVQYYDSRNILVPGALSEGGRRLYSEDDLNQMRIICFLREAGLSIKSIGELLVEEHPEKIISVLLNQQQQILRGEIAEGQKKLGIIENIKRELKEIENFSVESIGDIAYVMKDKNALAHGAYGHSHNRTAMGIHCFMDYQRSLVAVRRLGLCGSTVGNHCFNLLLQACRLYLSRVSRSIQTELQGNVLGVPHIENAPFDLSEVWT